MIKPNNPNLEFTVNWAKSNIKPKNVVCVSTEKTDYRTDDFLIGHEKTDDSKDRYLVINLRTGEVVADADSIELLGIRLRGYYIWKKNVNLRYVYPNIRVYAIDC